MPHGRHIYAKEYDTAKEKMCAYSQSDHALPHWKCVIRCCDKCPIVNISDQKIDDQYSETIPSIGFHIYHLIVRFSTYVRLPLNYKKNVASVNMITL